MTLEMGEANVTGLIAPEALKVIHDASNMPRHVPHASPPPLTHIEAEHIHPIEHIAHATFDAQKNHLNDPMPEKDFTKVLSVKRPPFHARPKNDDTEPYIDQSIQRFNAKYSPWELRKMQVRHNKPKRHDKGDPGVGPNWVSDRKGILKKGQVDTKNLQILMKDPLEASPTKIQMKKQKQRPVSWQKAEKYISKKIEPNSSIRNQILSGRADYRRPNHQQQKDELWSKKVTYFGRNRSR